MFRKNRPFRHCVVEMLAVTAASWEEVAGFIKLDILPPSYPAAPILVLTQEKENIRLEKNLFTASSLIIAKILTQHRYLHLNKCFKKL